PQERVTTEMIITVPQKFTAISNGALIRNTRRGKNRTFHWKHDVPHSPYLVSLVVGEFSEIRDRWKNVPVLYYCTPGREEDARLLRAPGPGGSRPPRLRQDPKDDRFLLAQAGRPLRLREILPGRGDRFHLRRDGKHLLHHPDRADAARRTRPHRFLQRSPGGP